MTHSTQGLARRCSATDMFLVAGGLQCANCLAHNVPPRTGGCVSITSDEKPCPLQAEPGSPQCWIHKMQTERSAK